MCVFVYVFMHVTGLAKIGVRGWGMGGWGGRGGGNDTSAA